METTDSVGQSSKEDLGTRVDIMLDLETMGTGSNAAIVAIGAVACFNITKVKPYYRNFYCSVELESSMEAGGKIEASTILWWMQQSHEARAALTDDTQRTIREALRMFSEWLAEVSYNKEVAMWGNGSDFDNVILANAYRNSGMSLPWSFGKNRCFRTMKNLSKHIAAPEVPNVVKHHALGDAIAQMAHLRDILISIEVRNEL